MNHPLYIISVERYNPKKSNYAPVWVNTKSHQTVLYDLDGNYLFTILNRLKRQGFPQWHPAGRHPYFYMAEIEQELSARKGTQGALISELYDVKQLNRTVLGLPLMKPYPIPIENSSLFGEKALISPPELFEKC